LKEILTCNFIELTLILAMEDVQGWKVLVWYSAELHRLNYI